MASNKCVDVGGKHCATMMLETMQVTDNKYSKELHPWNHYIPSGADKLFIGTFPTEERNRKFDFFYASSRNRFWDIVSDIASPFTQDLETIDEISKRKSILKKLRLGLTDMGKIILRQQGSSKDHSLFPLEFMNIVELLKLHSEIDTLIVSGNSNGNSSSAWFGIFCDLNGIPFNIKELERQKRTKIKMAGRDLTIFMTYSPSRLSRKTDEQLKLNYLEVFNSKKV